MIHYYKITVTDWGSEDEISALFVTAADLLGADLVYAQDYTAEEFTEEIDEFTAGTIGFTADADEQQRIAMTSILYTQEAEIVLFLNDDGQPACEVLAMPSAAADGT